MCTFCLCGGGGRSSWKMWRGWRISREEGGEGSRVKLSTITAVVCIRGGVVT